MGSSALRKPSETTLRIVAGLIALIGLGIASYIMVEQVRGEIPPCGRGGGCTTVLTSKYAELLGVPLYYFGVVGYISILVTILMGGDRGRLLGFVLSFFGFGMSAYLTFLQYVVIESICVWCRASAIAMTFLFLACLARLLIYYGTGPNSSGSSDDDDPAEGPSPPPPADLTQQST